MTEVIVAKRLFVFQTFSSEFDAAYQLIRAASQAAGVETWRHTVRKLST